jgi:hypothetical protein
VWRPLLVCGWCAGQAAAALVHGPEGGQAHPGTGCPR